MTHPTPSPSGRRAGGFPRVALAIGFAAWLAAAGTASAQSAGSPPALSYDTTVVARPGSPAGLRIEVQPPQAAPANTYLRIRGLPASASLNEGYRTGPGTWAVPLKSLPNLTVDAPAGTDTRTEVSLALTTIDGTVLVEGRLQLVFAPPGEAAAVPFALGAARPPDAPAVMGLVQQVAPPAPQPARRPDTRSPAPVETTQPAPPAPAQIAALPPAAQPTPQPAAPVTAPPPAATARPAGLSPQDAERAQRFIERGDVSLRDGDFSAARLFYQRAAAIGSTQAALKLARTYDPAEIARSGAVGFKADVQEARRWYERARELGSEEAAARLATLPAN